MQISDEALTDFIELYKAEFGEDIDRDAALIIARNLVIFYERLTNKALVQDIENSDGVPPYHSGIMNTMSQHREKEPDEATIVGNYKPDHLYTAAFREGTGKFFNIVTLDDGTTTIEYHQPIPTRNRIKLTITFIKDANDIKSVSFKKFKRLKMGWVDEGEEVVFSYFSFQKLAAFLQLLVELDLPGINERQVALDKTRRRGWTQKPYAR